MLKCFRKWRTKKELLEKPNTVVIGSDWWVKKILHQYAPHGLNKGWWILIVRIEGGTIVEIWGCDYIALTSKLVSNSRFWKVL